ncbi:hypothetical protein L1987_15578 [Smallanthus sonchifolius]|uniref:Uncharacterized protein n=1 Tax=Smallanthus sonchifolius TaxID=185202 RepID=A0ACB9J6I0_9ASTR|nr:hypothetical protein L1987_15578 [Smallanthus sonchifolius]
MKKKDDDLDDDKEGDEEEGPNEVEDEDDVDKEADEEGHNEGEDEESDDDKEVEDDMEDDKEGEEEDGDEEVIAKTDERLRKSEVEEVCKGNEEGEDEVCKGNEEGEDDVKETIVQQNVVIFEPKVEDEVVANNENEEVIRDEDIAENILVNETDGDEKLGTNNEEHEDKKEGGDDEEEQEGGDRFDDLEQEEETLIYCRTLVEREISKYDNMRLEETKAAEKEAKIVGKKKKSISPRSIEVWRKWRNTLFEANIGFTMQSLNRTGDERLLKELDNLKRLAGEKSVLKEVMEHKDTEKDDNDVDTLLASVSFLKVAMGEKISKIEALVTNYIF